MQLWCNESQERYVLGVASADLAGFEAICARERCPYAIVGHATAEPRLLLAANAGTPRQGEAVIDMPMDVLFGKPPKMHRDTSRPAPTRWPRLDMAALDLREAGLRVLAHPTVAAKNFLVTIGDRTVGGLSARDQMVGPWQLPLADCAISLTDFHGLAGEAMAIGERTPLALLDAAASARMAVGEAITNLAAAPVASLSEVKLSANWMAAAGHPGEDALLYDAVHAVGMELCPELDISIPVGKDSLSMQARWDTPEGVQQSVAPVSLIVTAFARVADARAQLTPVLVRDTDTELWLIGLGAGQKRLGGSVLAQVHGAFGGACPDLDDPARLKSLFELVQAARADGLLLAYHDRSDGGAFAAACEMAFASHQGLELNLDGLDRRAGRRAVQRRTRRDRAGGDRGPGRLRRPGQPPRPHAVRAAHRPPGGGAGGARARRPRAGGRMDLAGTVRCLVVGDACDAEAARRSRLRRRRARRAPPVRRSGPGAAAELRARAARGVDGQHRRAPAGGDPARAGREQPAGNGRGLHRAGFAAVDVHMSDLIAGRVKLADFRGLAACGGFSYGDVLGAGRGWATSILERPALRDQFAAFFERADSFSLGVCNGCQMLAQLKSLIPGAEHWPRFLRNRSEQFEARLSLVEVLESPSLFFQGMAGSRIPIVVSHGEGRAHFDAPEHAGQAAVALRYVEGDGRVASLYPANPNGSPRGIAGLCSQRRAQHLADAAPRARAPQRADELAPRRLGRGLALDAHVRERARLGLSGQAARVWTNSRRRGRTWRWRNPGPIRRARIR